MPLFGKKKEEKKVPPPAGYPTQPQYPTAPQYPTGNYPAVPGYSTQPPPGYPAQPPPYTQAAPAPGPATYQPPPPAGPGYSPYMAQPYQQPYYPGPPQNVVVQGGFDAGARFDGHSTPNIPPPPPGVAPNAAQVAAAQGHNVTVTQRQGNFLTGGSDGGYVLW